MGVYCFCVTQQGSSHIQNGSVCQDASGYRSVRMEKAGHNALLAAAADGVGSCVFSQYGSEIAVNSFLQYVEEHLPGVEKADDQSVAPVLKAGYQYALDKIEEDAVRNERPFAEMDTTLTAVIYLDDGTLWCGHIGDGGVVALYDDGTYEMITNRHKGEAANSVIPLREKSMWMFGRAMKPVASLALMTDGVLDVTVTSARYNERVYFPMLGAALANPFNTQEDADNCRRMMEEFLAAPEFRNRVKDDITFAALQNSDMVAALPEIQFDEQSWLEEQKQIHETIEAELRKAAEEGLESILSKDEQAEKSAGTNNPDDKQELAEMWRQVGENGKAFLDSTGSALNASIRRAVSDVRFIVQKKPPKKDGTGTAATAETGQAAPVAPAVPAKIEPAAPAEAEPLASDQIDPAETAGPEEIRNPVSEDLPPSDADIPSKDAL